MCIRDRVDTVRDTVRHFFRHASAQRLHCTQSAAENSSRVPVPSSGGSSLFTSAPVGQKTVHMKQDEH